MNPSLSTAELVVLDVLYGFLADDDTLMPMLRLDGDCRRRGLDHQETWSAIGDLMKAGLVETELSEYGTKSIRGYGFTDRKRAGEILFSSQPLPNPGPRSRPSSLAGRTLVAL